MQDLIQAAAPVPALAPPSFHVFDDVGDLAGLLKNIMQVTAKDLALDAHLERTQHLA